MSLSISVIIQNPWRWGNKWLIYCIPNFDRWFSSYFNCILSFAYCFFCEKICVCIRLLFRRMWLYKYCWRVPSDSCIAVFGLRAMVFVLLQLFSCHLLASERQHSYTVFGPHLSKERSCKEQKFILLHLTFTPWRLVFKWCIKVNFVSHREHSLRSL